MNLGPLPVLLAVLGAPLALFRRKAKDDWLGELEGIRSRGIGDLGPDDVEDDGDGGSGTVRRPAGGVAAPEPPIPAPPPAPHREHPSQLWHAPLEMSAVRMPPAVAPEETLDPAELADPSSGDLPIVGTGVGPGAASTPCEAGGAEHGGAEPVVDVVTAKGLLDDARPWDVEGATGRSDGELSRPRVKPPTDVFDRVPPPPDVDLDDGPTGGAPVTGPRASDHIHADVTGSGPARDLVGDPVGRRPAAGRPRRSLFGAEAVPTIIGTANAAVGRPLLVRNDGMVETDLGIIRLSERSRPEVVLNAQGVSLAIDSGWCWVALKRTGLPVSVAVPGGSVVVQPGTRVLAVVESDHSAFVSLVSGSAVLEGPSGSVDLAAGAIAHVPVEGHVTLDRATPDEMATDAILTRNLRLDDDIHPGAV